MSLDELTIHGLKALHTGNGNDEELNEKNIEVAQVGEGGFKLLKADEIRVYLDKLPKVPASLSPRPPLEPPCWRRSNHDRTEA